ncbi:hypothetical protein L7F22_026423 [Adiantum nelumboides]|nr:hypothetical protein [Adiantum nelumboides]
MDISKGHQEKERVQLESLSAPKFTYGQDNVEYTDAYTYLGVVFTGPKFALKKAADNRLSRAYAALGGLERMCSQVQFQEPRTKLWLFDTLVTSAMLYGVQVWGPSVDQDSWRAMERPLISMISRMIRAKASVPHAIIRAEVAAPPIETEALTKSVSFIHGIWNTDRCRYTRLALESSRQLALKGDTSCWYAKTNSWFQRHGFSMDRLPPFQYSLEAPSLPITKAERNRIIRQDLIQLDTKRTWVEPIQELGTKMAFYRGNFLQVSEDGFVTRPSYMDTHLSHGLRCAIGQIRTSSHQLEIEFGRFQGIPPEDRLSSKRQQLITQPTSRDMQDRAAAKHQSKRRIWLQDATFELERKRNRPERYDRNVVQNTIKAIKRIEEIRAKREEKFWESRMKVKKEKKADLAELRQNIHLVKAPVALQEDPSLTLPKKKEKMKVRVEAPRVEEPRSIEE